MSTSKQLEKTAAARSAGETSLLEEIVQATRLQPSDEDDEQGGVMTHRQREQPHIVTVSRHRHGIRMGGRRCDDR